MNKFNVFVAALSILSASGNAFAERMTVSTSTVLSLEQAVSIATAANSSVRAAEAQYRAAMHQVIPTYFPNDPQFSYSNNNSPNGLFNPSSNTRGISESVQFPLKGWLQGNQARRSAEIARLTYIAAVRDTRAQTETAYYQTLLDKASVEIASENAESLNQVLAVARSAYTANQVTESDLISAQFSMSQASQTVWADQVAESNDEAALNQVMERDPQSPLQLTSSMDLEPFTLSVEFIKDKALAFRQELLEAALTEKNQKTALKLAWMELLPDFSLSYSQNRYEFDSSSPAGSLAVDSKDNTASIGFNIPIFFWFHQKEDIQSASALLDAARWNRDSVEIQTKTSAVQLYRTTDLAYQTALLYRNFLVPLAEKNLQVALIAYQSKKIDFTTLASILQNLYGARITYLTSVNQFWAAKVGLEQLMGGPLK
jgi:cobalt-zinc-cadmium efflux system outer membrane protein